MKHILKLLIMSLIISVVFTGCTHEDVDWTTKEASFKLNDTSLGGAENVLYETMKNNPFTLVWESIGSGEYKAELSTTADFTDKTELGMSTENSLTSTIGILNTKLLQLGFSPYTSQLVYIRIVKGSDASNVISFAVKVYPTNGPIITAPANGSTITLNSANQSAIATTITWNDYSSYGSNVSVVYTVEIAKKGATTFSTLGEVTSVKSFAISNKDLNTAALTAGATVNVETELDFRITAKTNFSTPGIELKSAVVTAKLTPYQVDYPDFFLVGGASAIGWTPGDAIKLYKHDNISEVYTYLQPDQFRFLGQQSWTGINYSIDDPRTDAGNRYFKTVSSNVEFGDHENMKFTGTAGIYKVVIDADFGVKSLTVTPSNITSWDIPNLYIVGSINDWTPANSTEFTPLGNGVFETYVQLPDNSEFKFIGQKSWGSLEWGNINKNNDGNSGYLGPKDDNSNIKFSGGNTYYKITVNIKTGKYKIEPV